MSATAFDRFPPDVLVVFVGHSDDAMAEAEMLRALEQDMGREWERLQIAAKGRLPFRAVRVVEHTYDKEPIVGGQDETVNTLLDRANVALFVFKERVGEQTWKELERSRDRISPRIPIAAFFPENPPASSNFKNRLFVQRWQDLLDKQESLTRDWGAGAESKALQPVTYTDDTHLRTIALDGMKRAFESVLLHVATGESSPAPAPATFISDDPGLNHDRQAVMVHSVDDLDAGTVSRYLTQPLSRDVLQSAGLSPQHSTSERLAALGCLRNGRPAFGAFLCFGQKAILTGRFASCGLQMVAYDQLRKAESSSRIHLASGNLLALFDEAMSWLISRAGLRRLGRIGTLDRDELEVPEIALREAVANALVHRDYESPEAVEQPNRLEVFPDRVEIISYGNLLQPFSVEQLNGDTEHLMPRRRNPLIAQIFQAMSYVELNASGISRMRMAMEKASLGFPKFLADDTGGIVRVVLERPPNRRDEIELPSRAPRPGQLTAVISSTALDLPDHRQLAVETCLRLGIYPLMAEFGGDSLKLIDRADVFIGIYGWRYGALAPGAKVSVGEQEFARARELGIPMLLFLMHEDHPVTRSMVDTGKEHAKLSNFRTRLRGLFAAREFKSAADLGEQLTRALGTVEVKPRSEPPAPPKTIAASRLPSHGPLIGREAELAMLDEAWSGDSQTNVLTLVAFGGVGKSTLAAQWAATKYDEVERYFDWSFYRQGSNDMFLKAALDFFGDAELAASAADGWQKGERLAQLAGRHRTLLILDGLEPLQDAKTGELRDPALRSLLRGLAVRNRGLCIVTTRQEIPDLETFRRTTAPQWRLAHLSKEAGATLLQKLGVRGTASELETLAADVKGHALALTLLGKFLVEAHGGDVRRRDLVSLHEADYEETSGHAFRVVEAYERWLTRDGRHVELAILRLLGLFDRAAAPDCLAALRQAPAIDGLTDSLVSQTDAQWNLAVKRLVQLGFVETQPWEPPRIAGYSADEARRIEEDGIDPADAPPPQIAERRTTGDAVDAHPLIRGYFATRLRDAAPEAWRAAHGRLYEHLRDSVPYWPEGVDGLQPLYQAVVHGCHAGRAAETRELVYRDRILRGTSGPYAFYSTRILGLNDADLAAVRCFFTVPWKQLAPGLTASDQSWLLSDAAYRLRALGRVDEAREPMRTALEARIELEDWLNAAVHGVNLSELDLTLGDIAAAVRYADQSVRHADLSLHEFEMITTRTTYADALHQAGRTSEAGERFREAETLQAENAPATPLLYSLRGFRFCDLLLSEIDRAAWRSFLGLDTRCVNDRVLSDVERRATTALAVARRNRQLLSIALDNLTLGRVALFRAILSKAPVDGAQTPVEAAVLALRQAGQAEFIPRVLLTRAWLRAIQGNFAAASVDLNEAQQLAERGPMRLHLADVHLHRARLFYREDRSEAREELQKARAFIERCGYHRRDEELLDAEAVIRRQP